MSKRLSEELEFLGALAPVSVAASTATTTGYIDASETEEVCFLLSAASLASGKTIKATLMGSTVEAGRQRAGGWGAAGGEVPPVHQVPDAGPL